MTEIIEHSTITAIIENIEQTKAEVKQACEMLRAAQRRLIATIGSNRSVSIAPDIRGEYWLSEHRDKEVADHLTRLVWRYLVDHTGLRHYMTERRQRELKDQIERNDLPPLTTDNVLATLQGMAERVDSLLMESIKEVFDWLRPRNCWGMGEYKTNQKWQVGPRVIVTWAVNGRYGGGFTLDYSESLRAQWTALGNVFSLLDGKGIQRYPNDLPTRFNEAMKDAAAGDKFEDEYFIIRCYRNRNAHITFKRLDLVQKLNRIAGGDELPGTEAA